MGENIGTGSTGFETRVTAEVLTLEFQAMLSKRITIKESLLRVLYLPSLSLHNKLNQVLSGVTVSNGVTHLMKCRLRYHDGKKDRRI